MLSSSHFGVLPFPHILHSSLSYLPNRPSRSPRPEEARRGATITHPERHVQATLDFAACAATGGGRDDGVKTAGRDRDARRRRPAPPCRLLPPARAQMGVCVGLCVVTPLLGLQRAEPSCTTPTHGKTFVHGDRSLEGDAPPAGHSETCAGCYEMDLPAHDGAGAPAYRQRWRERHTSSGLTAATERPSYTRPRASV
jgi:hypothetical protein